MAGKMRPSLRAKTLLNVDLSNLSRTDKKCIHLVFNKFAELSNTVKHGHWIYDEKEECYTCSECGMSALNDYKGLSVASNGCPHCLAIMDGGKTEYNP